MSFLKKEFLFYMDTHICISSSLEARKKLRWAGSRNAEVS
jgi:hypothetical protein